MLNNKISKGGLILTITQFFLPMLALADDTGVDTISQTVKVVNLDDVLQKIRDLFFGAVIVACVFMILWAGFNLATAAGDEKKVTDAKKTITYALIGLIVAALASTLISIVRGLVD